MSKLHSNGLTVSWLGYRDVAHLHLAPLQAVAIGAEQRALSVINGLIDDDAVAGRAAVAVVLDLELLKRATGMG